MKKEIRKRIETLPQLDRIEIKGQVFNLRIFTALTFIFGWSACSAYFSLGLWYHLVMLDTLAGAINYGIGSFLVLFSTIFGIGFGYFGEKRLIKRWNLNG